MRFGKICQVVLGGMVQNWIYLWSVTILALFLPMPMKYVGGLRDEKSGPNSWAYPYKYLAPI